jgi:hypothetical protein
MTWQRAAPTVEDASIKKWRTRKTHEQLLCPLTQAAIYLFISYTGSTATAQFIKSYTHYVIGT